MIESTSGIDWVTQAELQRPEGTVLKGQFVDVLRSKKGKLKGITLRTPAQEYAIKLPKYLRPVVVRELAPHAFVQVWAYPDDDQWRGINILPLAEAEAITLRNLWQELPPPATPAQADSRPQLCVKVCSKGKCFKRGGRQILQTLQTEVAANPDLSHVSVKGVGCMSACKHGPNLQLSTSKKVISGVTATNASSLIAKHAKHQKDLTQKR